MAVGPDAGPCLCKELPTRQTVVEIAIGRSSADAPATTYSFFQGTALLTCSPGAPDELRPGIGWAAALLLPPTAALGKVESGASCTAWQADESATPRGRPDDLASRKARQLVRLDTSSSALTPPLSPSHQGHQWRDMRSPRDAASSAPANQRLPHSMSHTRDATWLRTLSASPPTGERPPNLAPFQSFSAPCFRNPRRGSGLRPSADVAPATLGHQPRAPAGAGRHSPQRWAARDDDSELLRAFGRRGLSPSPPTSPAPSPEQRWRQRRGALLEAGQSGRPPL